MALRLTDLNDPNSWSDNPKWTAFMKENKVLDLFDVLGREILKNVKTANIYNNPSLGLGYILEGFEDLEIFFDFNLLQEKAFRFRFWICVEYPDFGENLFITIWDDYFEFKYEDRNSLEHIASGSFNEIIQKIDPYKWGKIFNIFCQAKFPKDNSFPPIFIHRFEMYFTGQALAPKLPDNKIY